jgi:hypothetical protein
MLIAKLIPLCLFLKPYLVEHVEDNDFVFLINQKMNQL